MTVHLDRVAVSLSGKRRFTSAGFVLPAKTEYINLRLARETSVSSGVVYPETTDIRLILTVDVDGEKFFCTADDFGGIQPLFWSDKRASPEREESVISWTLPYGYFGRRSGVMERLGESKSVLTLTATVELLSGSIDSFLILESGASDAPAVEWFSNSPAFDAASSVYASTGATSVSLSHTAAGSSRLVILGAYTESSSGATNSTSATVAGNAATLLGDNDGYFSTYNNHAAYYIKDASAGSGAQTSQVNYSTTTHHRVLCVMSLTDVDQTTSVGTYAFAPGDTGYGGDNPTVSVAAPASDSLVVDFVHSYVTGGGANTITVGANQTQRVKQENAISSNDYIGAMSTQSGADGAAMTWTKPVGGYWSIGAVEVKAAAGGGGSYNAVPLLDYYRRMMSRGIFH